MRTPFDLLATPIEDGVTVIEASAGTGKTYTLVGLVLRLLLERRVDDAGRLLAVTFTNAATDELVERIRRALLGAGALLAGGRGGDPLLEKLVAPHRGDPDARRLLDEALARFDDLTVVTIHGFCKRVLDDSAFESGLPFDAELVGGDDSLRLEAARDFWRRRLYRAGDLAAAVAVASGWTPETFLPDHERWRRHPATELLPPPRPLERAYAELEDAYRALRGVWDRGTILEFLGERRLRKGTVLGSGLERQLALAEAFCVEGQPAGLRPLAELARPRLERALYKSDQAGVGDEPIVRAASVFAEAVETLRHALRARFLDEVETRFDAAKRRAGVLTYDDLLHRLRAALAGPRGPALAAAVRRRYQAVLVDEFQDTDLVQYDIFRRLFRAGPTFLIGDPKQAIYRFRGADVYAYMAARDAADRVYGLGRNWRAAPPLVAATNAVFDRAERPFALAEIGFEPARPATALSTLEGDGDRPLTWLWFEPERSRDEARRHLSRAVAAEVTRLLTAAPRVGERPLAPADVAVLVRTNAEAQVLQEALRARGVPSVVGRSGDVFHSDEMAELELLLAAILDPADAERLRAAWATRLWGDDARKLRALDDETVERRLERVERYRGVWLRRGFMPMIQSVVAERRVRQRLLALAGGERRLTNLLHAVELLHREVHERHLSPAALLHWLAIERQREHPESDATELRLESDAEAVQIATVHRSKGLEYEVVFCPFLWQAQRVDRPPVEAHAGPERLVYDCGSEALETHQAQAEAERLAEDLRLVYVALTRARRRCYVAWGEVAGKDGSWASAPGYLLHGAAPAADGETAGAFPGAGAGEWVERALETAKTGREGWRRGLEDFVARHGEVMTLRPIVETAAPLAAPAGERGALAPRVYRAPAPRAWGLTSFTSLARGDAGEVPDHRDPALPALADEPAGPDVGLAGFAGGTRAGTALHRVLERVDLAALDAPETARLVSETLRRYGLDRPRAHRDATADFDPAAAVHDLLRRLAAARFPGGFALAEVPVSETLREWRFHTPLAGLAPRALAELFATHARGAVREDYAPRLATLDRGAVEGFLTGFVDLILRHDGRYYVVDWKSNLLGAELEAYRPEGLWPVMQEHHYVLQYHLYLVALCRYLRHRLPDFDYERHVGGVGYVFLRGVGRDGNERTGWYVDRPSASLIAALDELLGGGTA